MAEARGMWCVPCLASLEILQELCRTGELTCAALGIGRGELTEYEVEYLCGFKKEKGTEYYLVKWKEIFTDCFKIRALLAISCRALIAELVVSHRSPTTGGLVASS